MKTLQRLPFVEVASMLALSALVYGWLPEQVPIHWDRWGRPDGWASRAVAAVMMPLVGLATSALLALLARLSPRGYEPERFADAWHAVVACLVGFLAFVHAIILGSGLGLYLAVHRVVPAAIGLLVAAIGLYLPRLRRNFWMGIRTPWTLASETAWDRTHAIAGPVWVVGGFALAVTGWWAAARPLLWLAVWVALIGGTLAISWSCAE